MLLELANAAVTQDEADLVILASALLAGLAERAKDRTPVPVVDQMAAAVKQAEVLANLRVRKASGGTWLRPAASRRSGSATRWRGPSATAGAGGGCRPAIFPPLRLVISAEDAARRPPR